MNQNEAYLSFSKLVERNLVIQQFFTVFLMEADVETPIWKIESQFGRPHFSQQSAKINYLIAGRLRSGEQIEDVSMVKDCLYCTFISAGLLHESTVCFFGYALEKNAPVQLNEFGPE
jgi:hypothetical protein